MYLYLGRNKVVLTDEVVGIFDLENTSVSRLTKGYLAKAQKSGDVCAVSTELPKSFVVAGRKNKQTVYISQISTATLKKRSGTLSDFSKQKG